MNKIVMFVCLLNVSYAFSSELESNFPEKISVNSVNLVLSHEALNDLNKIQMLCKTLLQQNPKLQNADLRKVPLSALLAYLVANTNSRVLVKEKPKQWVSAIPRTPVFVLNSQSLAFFVDTVNKIMIEYDLSDNLIFKYNNSILLMLFKHAVGTILDGLRVKQSYTGPNITGLFEYFFENSEGKKGVDTVLTAYAQKYSKLAKEDKIEALLNSPLFSYAHFFKPFVEEFGISLSLGGFLIGASQFLLHNVEATNDNGRFYLEKLQQHFLNQYENYVYNLKFFEKQRDFKEDLPILIGFYAKQRRMTLYTTASKTF